MKEKIYGDYIIPYGRYQGKKMKDIPAKYLVWLYNHNRTSHEVAKYVRWNRDVLLEEIEDEKRKTNNGN